MALTTYSTLKTEIENWAHRSNIDASTVDTFIDLAEAEFNVRLRTVDQETVAGLTCNTRFTSLPSDFLEMRLVEFEATTLANVTFATPEYLTRLRAKHTAGDPVAYSIRGTTIELVPSPGADDPDLDGFGSDMSPFEEGEVDLILTYWAKVAALSDSNTTNWLLTNHPNMYLYECLRQLSIYVKDDSGMARYAKLLQGYYDSLQRQDRRKRWGGGLRVRVA